MLRVATLAMLILGLGVAAYAAPITYYTVLNGANEVPPTGSPGGGTSTVVLNGDTLTVHETFFGLTTAANAAHIHCCGPVGVNEPVALPFPSFPSAVSGTYDQSFNLTLTATYLAPFVTANGGTAAGAEAALITALNGGQTYANIHNATNPGGEIRGQLQIAPESSTAGLLLVGLALVLIAGRRQKASAA